MGKTRISEKDYVKAVKKADRENEITKHGKQISMKSTKIHKSKMDYDRKKYKTINIDGEED